MEIVFINIWKEEALEKKCLSGLREDSMDQWSRGKNPHSLAYEAVYKPDDPGTDTSVPGKKTGYQRGHRGP